MVRVAAAQGRSNDQKINAEAGVIVVHGRNRTSGRIQLGGQAGKRRLRGEKPASLPACAHSVVAGALLGWLHDRFSLRPSWIVWAEGMHVALHVQARWCSRCSSSNMLPCWLWGWGRRRRGLPALLLLRRRQRRLPLLWLGLARGCCILLHVCNSTSVALPRAGLAGEGAAADTSGGAVVGPAALAAAAALDGCAPGGVVPAAVVPRGLVVAAAPVAARLVGAAAVVAAAVVAAAAAAAVGAVLIPAAAAVAGGTRTAAVMVVMVVVTEKDRVQ